MNVFAGNDHNGISFASSEGGASIRDLIGHGLNSV